jgi:PTH2 family peptidyl-tRNA hydrolase
MKQVIVIRKDLKMGQGKAIAQACHASVGAFMLSDKTKREDWFYGPQKKVVCQVDSIEEFLDVDRVARENKVTCCVISDAGKTELGPGTITALAIGPDTDERLKFTETLKLY